MNLKIGQNGINLIESFESFQSKPYEDPVGIPTIGYGATYYPGGTKVTMQDPEITQPQAEDMLKTELNTYERAADSYVKSVINQNQFDSLVSFAYNLGVNSLKSSTLMRKVNINTEDPSIRAEFMKWVHAGGQVLEGLVRRRTAEANLYYTPISS